MLAAFRRGPFGVERLNRNIVTLLQDAKVIPPNVTSSYAGKPILITQHGIPAAYLVDAQSFEELQRRLSLLEGISRGERAVDEGRVMSHARARSRMARRLK